jgi:hypothetical protein
VEEKTAVFDPLSGPDTYEKGGMAFGDNGGWPKSELGIKREVIVKIVMECHSTATLGSGSSKVSNIKPQSQLIPRQF